MTVNLEEIVSIGRFENLPPRTRNGGGGGRRSELMDLLREELAEEGTSATIKVQPQYKKTLNKETGKKEPVVDEDQNPVMETVREASERMRMRFYAKQKGVYPLGFKPYITINEDDATITIYHPRNSGSEGE